jgi:hypothetical protein
VTDSLDDILARKQGEQPAPAQEQTTQETTQATEQPEATSAEAPAQETAPDGQQQTKMVPHEALHAEKQKVKRYTEQVASFEETIKQRDEAWERRFNQMLERFPKQEAPQVDWYADPQAAFKQGLGEAINPIEQKFANLEFQLMRLSAEQRYGADKIREFETFAEEAAKRGDPEIQALAVEMRSSKDPIAVGLKWYEKKTFDPEAEREKIRATVLEEMKSQQTPHVPAVMPSQMTNARNVGQRSGPQWGGPPSLNDIFKR